MKKIIVGLLALVSSSPVVCMENLARALREIALSAPSKEIFNPPAKKDWEFKLSEIKLADAAPESKFEKNNKIRNIIDTLAKQDLDPATIANYMAIQYKANSKTFPLTQCDCMFFKRSSIDEASIRTSYEQLVIQKLIDGWTTKKDKGGKVAYISVGSGGLLTDFSIADQFLDKVPNANLTIHAVDTEYKHYLQLLDFCKGEPFLTKESIDNRIGYHGSVQLGWSLNNAKSTKNFATGNGSIKESIIRDLIIPHEQFQRFLYLLTKRHPKATVKLELWSSMKGPENEINRIAPDFIGSIDALDQKGKIFYIDDNYLLKPGANDFDKGISVVEGPIFTDFKSLCAACINNVRKTCDNLAVGRYNTDYAVLLGRFIHKDNFDPEKTDWDYAWLTKDLKIKKQTTDIITLISEFLNTDDYAKNTQKMIDQLK
ncbi:TPA: hypothetical protein DDZ86_04285 [Candidatus Dependentiae bacterium]|nr:MAG: hypothetical protein UW09_C0003G0206 [candidate division TM6 bacterium GW2011_GWF2_43_87]HBL98833.1 hypothetical protein [Candidatus Dependentiae bacterium]